MPGSTTGDLWRLPAPVVVEQLEFGIIRAALIAAMHAALPSFTAAIASDPVVKLIEIVAYRELLLRRTFQDAALQNFVAYATGTALDHLAALVA